MGDLKIDNVLIDTLNVHYICMEYSNANLVNTPQPTTPTKLYNFIGLARTLITLLSIYVFSGKGVAQAITFLVCNLGFLALTFMNKEKLVHKNLVMVREYLFLLWSILILVNAYDDLNPIWGLTSFWVISISCIVFKFLIMLIEMIIYLDVVMTSMFRSQILKHKKEEIHITEKYV